VKSSGLVKFETSILLNELIYLSPALSSSCCMTPSDIIEERIKEMVTQLDSFAKKVVNAIGIFRGGTSDHKEIKLLTSSFSSTIVFNEENKKIPTKINGLIKCLAYVPREVRYLQIINISISLSLCISEYLYICISLYLSSLHI
jgi:hypothetical protein